jgi:hypothetical protein
MKRRAQRFCCKLDRRAGDLDDQEIVARRERFQMTLSSCIGRAGFVAIHFPDRRPLCDDATWNKLHEFGLKTTSTEEKQNYYDALLAARDPKLAPKLCKFR